VVKKFLFVTFILAFTALANLTIAQDSAPSSHPSSESFRLTELAQGFTRPLGLENAGDGSGRLFVVEQGGRVYVVQDGEKSSAPFLDISSLVSQEANDMGYTERGLLGLAFAPDYADSGRFYVNYTDVDGNSVVARYLVNAGDPSIADPNSGEIILFQQQPFANHNGGSLGFGSDGFLYIGLGDGGSQGDPYGNGQNLYSWLGKILRIDVSGETGYTVPDDNPFVNSGELPEIWAYGLRNPWRFSFDAETGDLLIGDVGGSEYEEINFAAAGEGGLNFGWNTMEGLYPTGFAPAPDDTVLPIANYDHSLGVSVSGGYVYRGEAIPQLRGVYFYGDWGSGNIWAAWRNDAGEWQSELLLTGTGMLISSFGVDEANELYVVDYSGSIYRFDPAG
jgi:glucose/arabinose dehydrogenase